MPSLKPTNKYIFFSAFIFLYFILELHTKHVWAQTSSDLITERAWLIDQSGLMTWEEVQQSKDWQIKTDSPVFGLGYGKGAAWFRLRIDPERTDLAPDAKLVMRIRPAYLDQLQLFDPLQSPAVRPLIGDKYPKTGSIDPSSSLSYSLPAGSSSREVWVRLETTSTRMAHFDVMDEQSMRKSNKKIEHLGALYLGTIFVFIIWGLIQLTVQMERLSLIFVLYQGAALVFGFCLFGYASLYLTSWFEPTQVDFLTSFSAVSSTLLVSVFAQQILGNLKINFLRKFISLSTYSVFIFCFGMVTLGEARIGLQINMTLIFILPIIHFFIAVFTTFKLNEERKPTIPRTVRVFYFSITLAITLLTSMPALNLVPATELSHYIVSFYSVCSGFLMMMVIHYRGVQSIKDHNTLTVKAEQAEQQAVKERQFRNETEQLLTMLGHELKTPLSTLLLHVGSPELPANLANKLSLSVSEISNVIERTIQIGQVTHQKIEINPIECSLSDLLRSLVDSMDESGRLKLVIKNMYSDKLNTDVYLLTIIIKNLLDNSLKYSPPDSDVLVILNQGLTAIHWDLYIQNMPGRAEWPDAKKVFEKYYRSPSANYRSGTGLGLFLVKSLAEKLNIEVSYQPSQQAIIFKLKINHCCTDQ